MAKKLKDTYIHTYIHTYRQTYRLPLVVLSAALQQKTDIQKRKTKMEDDYGVTVCEKKRVILIVLYEYMLKKGGLPLSLYASHGPYTKW